MRAARSIKVAAALAVCTVLASMALMPAVANSSPPHALVRGAAPRSSPPSAAELYQKSLNADANFSYSGKEFDTTWDEDGRATVTVTRVSHQAADAYRFVYIAPRRLRGRIVLKVGSQEWTYLPRRSEVDHLSLAPMPSSKAPAAKLALLNKNYRLVVSPRPTMISGRKVYEVSMLPVAPGRRRIRYWIDPYTGMWLRREEVHADGTYVSETYYSDINFHPKFPAGLFSESSLPKHGVPVAMAPARSPEPHEKRLSSARLKGALGGQAVMPARIGPYLLQGGTISGTTLHLHYSDGLKILSLSEALRTSRYPTRVPGSYRVLIRIGEAGSGMRHAPYSLLNWDTPRLNLTLIGEISVRALAVLARQVEATKPG